MAAEKDRLNTSPTEKLDAVVENHKQYKLYLDSWLAKELKWNKEREDLLKTIKDLSDIVKILLHTDRHAKAISRLKYLKAFYHKLIRGRTDYEPHPRSTLYKLRIHKPQL